MARTVSIAALTLFMTLAATGNAFAEQKKSAKQKALDKCTHNVNVCNVGCDKNSKTNDALSTCLKNCQTKYNRCRQRVDDMYLSGGDGGDSLDRPGVIEAPQ